MMRTIPTSPYAEAKKDRLPSFVAAETWLKFLARECEADPSLAIALRHLVTNDPRGNTLRAAVLKHAGSMEPLESVPSEEE